MLKTIHLHGPLAEKYGPRFNLAIETPAEGLRALLTQLPGFEVDIRAGSFTCIRGDAMSGIDCDEDLLRLNLGSIKDFHIIPVAAGSKGGAGKVLLGVALIGATIISGGAALAAMPGFAAEGLSGALLTTAAGFGGFGLYTAGVGAMLILGGVSQAISKMPKMNTDTGSVDDKAGFLFNGAVNSSEQGGAVPLVFGRITAGSYVVSAGISAERTQYSVNNTAGTPASTGDIDYSN